MTEQATSEAVDFYSLCVEPLRAVIERTIVASVTEQGRSVTFGGRLYRPDEFANRFHTDTSFRNEVFEKTLMLLVVDHGLCY